MGYRSQFVLLLVVLLVLGGMSRAQPTTAQDATPGASPVALGAVEFVGEISGGAGEVAVAPDGTVWAVGDNQIHIFDPSGTPLETWGTAGAEPGQFDFSTYGGAVGFDGEGNIYVIESGNLRVQKFDPEHQFVAAWGSFGTGDGQFVAPVDIAVAPDGTVYVSDIERRDVQQFASDGTFLATVSPGGVGRIAVDPHGNLYVASGGPRVFKFAPDGTLLLEFGSGGTGDGQFIAALAVAANAAGTIFVSDLAANRIQAFDEEGRFLAAWGEPGSEPGQFVELDAIALDNEGQHLYALDFGNERIQKFRLLPPLAPDSSATPVS